MVFSGFSGSCLHSDTVRGLTPQLVHLSREIPSKLETKEHRGHEQFIRRVFGTRFGVRTTKSLPFAYLTAKKYLALFRVSQIGNVRSETPKSNFEFWSFFLVAQTPADADYQIFSPRDKETLGLIDDHHYFGLFFNLERIHLPYLEF